LKAVKVWLPIVLAVFGVVATAQDLSTAQTIRIGVLKNGAYEIVTMPLEAYVARVLTGEALPGSEPAAMEALAIAIRTYTIGNRGKHRADGFDLCDQTHCQVMRASSPVTERAALATAGKVLLYHGEPATVYYSASCGGRTEKPSNVWPGAEDPAYLPSRPDDGCQGTPVWSTELSLSDLQRALRAAGFTGILRDIRIAQRNESGRAARLSLEGMTPREISGQDLRAAIGRTIGWQYLQSAAFDLTRSGKAMRFAGHGAGHGVGMCVIGSTKLAIAGESAAQILARYFPGTEVGSVGPRLTAAPAERPSISPPPPSRAPAITPPGPPAAASSAPSVVRPSAEPTVSSPAVGSDVALSLSEGDEGERAVVAAIVVRERDAMSRAMGVSAPGRLTIRFQPTTDAFERTTGQPWFVLGSARTADVDFIPLVVLRDRGILERAIRAQIAHAIADPILAGRPAWVRHGAAAHFSEGSPATAGREPCPSDVELTRPASAGAFGDALARARGCFERQLASGKPWQEIR
jgi:SpoIID/LytB domain protein